LKYLNLGGCEKLEHLALKCSNLEQLNLYGCFSMCCNKDTFKEPCPKLHLLCVSRVDTTEIAEMCPNVSTWEFIDCKVNDNFIEAFVKSFKSSILSLTLGPFDQITNKSLFLIAWNCPNLLYLELLACSKITPAGLRVIASNTRLRQLNVHGCKQVSKEDVRQLALEYDLFAKRLQHHCMENNILLKLRKRKWIDIRKQTKRKSIFNFKRLINSCQ